MTNKERHRLVLVQLFVILVIVNCSFGDVVNSGVPHDINIVDTDSQPLSLIVVEDSAYDKRNNVNRFKNFMINKDQPERFDDEARDEQIYYIPRVASGKKRDLLAYPGTRVRVGNSNFRPQTSFGYNSRPAP
ncbi:hypothetical protein ACKWTF_012832 [Chironomus riparius]